MRIGVCTDAGKVREINQDDYAIHENGYGLYVVADGMGGHQCGEIASRTAVEAIQEHVTSYITPDLDNTSTKGILYEAFRRANKRILEYAKLEPSCSGMGTTLTLLYHCGKHSFVGHVGDSRAYIMREGELNQVTEDHSLVEELRRRGEITEEEASNHPQKHVITRALGMGDTVRADLIPIELYENDHVLLCTDGLTNLVSHKEIKQIIQKHDSEQEAVNQLVQLAIERGGHDNITVLLVRIQPDIKESR